MPSKDQSARQHEGVPAASTADSLRRELEDLGLSSYEARVLLALLRYGPANSADLAKVSGVPRTSAYQVIEELGAKRLVERVPGGRAAVWAAPGTDLVFDRLDAAQEERLRDHRARTARLRQVLAQPEPDAGAVATPFVHTVKGAAEVRAIYDRLLQNAVDEVLVFNLPPYSSPNVVKQTPTDPTGQDEVNPYVLDAIDRGVRFRALYEASHWNASGAEQFRQAMSAYHRAGVKGRLVNELPTKLAVADRSSVLVALPDPQQQIGFPTNLLIDHPGFAALQADAFEYRWSSARAIPRTSSAR